jgi:hypothetical protein
LSEEEEGGEEEEEEEECQTSSKPCLFFAGSSLWVRGRGREGEREGGKGEKRMRKKKSIKHEYVCILPLSLPPSLPPSLLLTWVGAAVA